MPLQGHEGNNHTSANVQTASRTFHGSIINSFQEPLLYWDEFPEGFTYPTFLQTLGPPQIENGPLNLMTNRCETAVQAEKQYISASYENDRRVLMNTGYETTSQVENQHTSAANDDISPEQTETGYETTGQAGKRQTPAAITLPLHEYGNGAGFFQEDFVDNRGNKNQNEGNFTRKEGASIPESNSTQASVANNRNPHEYPALAGPSVFTSPPEANHHLARTHIKPHVCPHLPCRRGFSTAKDLKRHIKTVHIPSSNRPKCLEPGCSRNGKPFSRQDNYVKHLREVHKQSIGRSRNSVERTTDVDASAFTPDQDGTPVAGCSKGQKRHRAVETDDEQDELESRSREDLIRLVREGRSKCQRLEEKLQQQEKQGMENMYKLLALIPSKSD